MAEKRGGAEKLARGDGQLAGGRFFSILVITTHHEGAFLMALIAAFAEAAGDTVSSEIGQWLSGRAYLITTFQPVPAGEFSFMLKWSLTLRDLRKERPEK